MKTNFIIKNAIAIAFGSFIIYQTGCRPAQQEEAPVKAMTSVERGRYLVSIGGCNDCHTPKLMTDKGPVLDESLLFKRAQAGNGFT